VLTGFQKNRNAEEMLGKQNVWKMPSTTNKAEFAAKTCRAAGLAKAESAKDAKRNHERTRMDTNTLKATVAPVEIRHRACNSRKRTLRTQFNRE
jgi:hypothetical protein